MKLGERIDLRRIQLGLSQSELARRVGVRQSTMNSLIRGESYSSRHLLKIARELQVSPAYLTGEVDDPEQDAPSPPALSREQSEMLRLFDALDGPERALLTGVARSMCKGVSDDTAASIETDSGDMPAAQPTHAPSYREFTLPVLFPPEYALTRMFEALLAMVDPAAPAEEQARLLARTLPIGLSQLRDLLPPPAPADHEDASSVRPKTLAEPR